MKNTKSTIYSINTRKYLQNTRTINFLKMKSLKYTRMDFSRKKYDYYEQKDLKVQEFNKQIPLQENM